MMVISTTSLAFVALDWARYHFCRLHPWLWIGEGAPDFCNFLFLFSHHFPFSLSYCSEVGLECGEAQFVLPPA